MPGSAGWLSCSVPRNSASNTDLARKSFERAVNLDPNYERPYCRWGKCNSWPRNQPGGDPRKGPLRKSGGLESASGLANAYLRMVVACQRGIRSGSRCRSRQTKVDRLACCWEKFNWLKDGRSTRGKRGKNSSTICRPILRRVPRSGNSKLTPARREKLRTVPMFRCPEFRMSPTYPS